MVSASCARSTVKASKLTTGTEYLFRIKAENRFGMGPTLTSESVTAQHPYKVPGPPTQLTVSRVTKDSATLQWSEPTDDGGSPVTGYQMEHKDRNSILWQVKIDVKAKKLQSLVVLLQDRLSEICAFKLSSILGN